MNHITRKLDVTTSRLCDKRWETNLEMLKALMEIARIQQSGDIAYSKLYTSSQLPEIAIAKASRQSTLCAKRKTLAMIQPEC